MLAAVFVHCEDYTGVLMMQSGYALHLPLVRFGEWNDAIMLRRTLRQTYWVNRWARRILNGNFQFSWERCKAAPALYTGSDLGFSSDTMQYAAFCEAVQDAGLWVSPGELGPLLRLAYAQQPFGETIVIPTTYKWTPFIYVMWFVLNCGDHPELRAVGVPRNTLLSTHAPCAVVESVTVF